MATMASQPNIGGGALGTPPSTAAPSNHTSRQVSREPSASIGNDPYSGGGGARGTRANPIADPPPALRGEGAAAAAASVAPGAPSGANINSASQGSPSSPNSAAAETISYSAERIIGNGSFGVVFQASVVETGEIVAIKKVLQDKRFKNRELQIMRQLGKDGHSNIVGLKHCFYSQVSSIVWLVGWESI